MNADPKLVVRFVIREVVGAATIGVALFWAAGRIDWWPGWALIILTLLWSTAMGLVIVRNHPSLLAERLGPRQDAKSWDVTIMSLFGLLTLVKLVVAGLDHRYGWSSDIIPAAQIAALAVAALGYALGVWATAANAFFSQLVRIQTERGHTVATGGPYRFVRHPGYLGTIVTELAVPVLLASWWALLAAGIGVMLLVVRTILEDRTLQSELPGYAAYAQRVPYRLLPGIW